MSAERHCTKLSFLKKLLIRWFLCVIFVITTLIVLAPVLLRSHGNFILTKMFFQTWSRYYPWIDLTDPTAFKLNAVNVYEQVEPNVTIGIWYTLPSTVQIHHELPTLADHLQRYVVSKDLPIIMYLHGQDGTRATHYRSNHYRVMSSFGNHIIAMDYRGYGDSTGKPTVSGIVADVTHVFNVIRRVCPDNPIVIWGHSMGTGVSLWTAFHLFENKTLVKKPAGLVLEAPFYNLVEALISYPVTRVFKINPYFMKAALDSLAELKLEFPNNEIISFLPLPIIIIHSEDDAIIPYHHAQSLEKYIETNRESDLPPVRLITVPRSAHCGHNHIYSYSKFQEIIEMTDVEPTRQWPRPIRILTKLLVFLSIIYVLSSAISAIILIAYPSMIKHIVFMNFLKTGNDFTQPEMFGEDRVFNFYLDVEPEIRIGVWHYRSPLVRDQSYENDEDYFQKHIASTSSSIPMVIYLHGNAFDRSLFNRRGTCGKLRRELKYDVFMFDYRGFGDSTGSPTEEGLIQDARYVYDWLHNMTNGQRKIYLWGQSLGSAVACQLAARLSDDESKTLAGIVLEAAFINMHQAIRTHYLSLLFQWQPWFTSLTGKALLSTKLGFQTRGHLSSVNCPCVILHADDDYTVPYNHGQQLLQAGIAARDDHRQKRKLLHFTIDMISFHGEGYGHSTIFRAPNLIPALRRVLFEEHI
ncbi:unnamed protein product [Adineta ricciae]|uniref:Uncharacterized protein n=2 Tax=Adineta ricciae TaxID=249248 RepID=A0A813SKF8_ADIRI|nr:unnamed protein product [Adineta ricciae]